MDAFSEERWRSKQVLASTRQDAEEAAARRRASEEAARRKRNAEAAARQRQVKDELARKRQDQQEEAVKLKETAAAEEKLAKERAEREHRARFWAHQRMEQMKEEEAAKAPVSEAPVWEALAPKAEVLKVEAASNKGHEEPPQAPALNVGSELWERCGLYSRDGLHPLLERNAPQEAVPQAKERPSLFAAAARGSRGALALRVRGPNGSLRTVSAWTNTTGREAKELIAENMRIPAERQRLVVGSSELHDDTCLGTTFKAGAVAFITLELRDLEEAEWLVRMEQAGPDAAEELREAPDAIKANRYVVMAAVERCGLALQHASQDLQCSQAVVLAAVRQDGTALQYAAQALRADEEVVLAAVNQSTYATQYASEDLRLQLVAPRLTS